MNDMIQLTGLWINKSESGEVYMVGYLGNTKVLIFKNKFKTDDKHPDYTLNIAAKIVDSVKSDEPPF